MSVLFVKQRSSVAEQPFGEIRSNVCDSSLAYWKARSRLPITEHFSLAVTAEALQAGVGQFEAKY